jgi:hypothetical protein
VEFFSLFNGKFDVSLKGLTYEKTYNWLSEEDGTLPLQKACACMVFFSKPLVFLETGKTKTGKGDGSGVDLKLLNYLPLLTKEEAATVTNEHRVKSNFRAVNFTMVKNVALLFAQIGPVKGLVLQFHRKWGGNPANINTTRLYSTGSQTDEIFAGNIDLFMADQLIWGNYNWVPFFQ